jgi:hypothetical protein
MNPVKISREEIEALAGKVSGLALQPHERELLLAIFAAAADHAEPAATGDPKGKLPATAIKGRAPKGSETTPAELKRQLLNAYFPGTNENPDTGTWQMKIVLPTGGGPP